MNRVLGRVRAAGVLVVAVLCVPACSPGGDAPDGARGASSGDDPKTWTLPLQSYMPDEKQQQMLTDARESLLVTCMARYGFSYEPAPPMPEFGPESLTDLRYGIHDGKVVAQYGYKPAVDMATVREQERVAMESTRLTPAEEAVMTGGQANTSAKDVPEGGCAGEAYRKLMGDLKPQSTLASDLSNTAYVKAQQDPAVKKSFSGWSACMADKGYEYGKPMDAVDDPRFATDRAGALELATAGADLACREEHQVVRTWYRAEVDLQNDLIEENAERLGTARSDLAAAVKRASRILDEEG
ncbi:hypothetical protein ACFUN7_11550 [Streptomyces sp. NPDC057236]|uniref:hypothetical protein n=1 Tax=Streptomyces sp. NPDC057236 TaxID=3346059 RepID=UPI00363884B6